jgi:hypothetical protein
MKLKLLLTIMAVVEVCCVCEILRLRHLVGIQDAVLHEVVRFIISITGAQ